MTKALIGFLAVIPFAVVFNPYYDRLLISGVFCSFMLMALIVRTAHSRQIFARPFWWPLAFLVGIFTSYLLTPMGVMNREPLIVYAVGVACFYLVAYQAMPMNLKAFKHLIVLSGCLASVYGILEFAGVRLWFDYTASKFPLFGHKNNYAGFLVICYPLAYRYRAGIIPALLMSFGIFISGSRGAFVAWLIVSVWVLYKNRSERRFLPISIIIVILCAVSMSDRISSPMALMGKLNFVFTNPGIGRQGIWLQCLERLQNSPFGVGLGNMIVKSKSFLETGDMVGPHNILIDLYGNGMIWSLTIFVVMLWKLWSFSRSAYSKTEVSLLWAAVGSYLISGLFNPCHKFGLNVIYFFVVMALIFRLSNRGYLIRRNRLFVLRKVFAVALILLFVVGGWFQVRFYAANIYYNYAMKEQDLLQAAIMIDEAAYLENNFLLAHYANGIFYAELGYYEMSQYHLHKTESLFPDYGGTREILNFVNAKLWHRALK